MVDQRSMGRDIGTKGLRVGVLRHTRNAGSHGTQLPRQGYSNPWDIAIIGDRIPAF